ncbi:MAG: O-methyltransferase [Gemmatimonadales bacterium]
MTSVRHLARTLRRHLRSLRPGSDAIDVTWQKRSAGSWLARSLGDGPFRPLPPALEPQIEALAARSEDLGAKPLWEGYREVYRRDPNVPGASANFERSSEQVRSQPVMGRFFAWLAASRKPGLVVEFGSAFGVSGMYWLAGVRAAGAGRLLTFEPNRAWQPIAAENLRQIDGNFTAVQDTFEAAIDRYLQAGEKIDIAFIDAIHTGDFVRSQVELLIARLAPGGLILLDDINFSADMTDCWNRLAADSRIVASAALGGRIGLLEFRSASRPSDVAIPVGR